MSLVVFSNPSHVPILLSFPSSSIAIVTKLVHFPQASISSSLGEREKELDVFRAELTSAFTKKTKALRHKLPLYFPSTTDHSLLQQSYHSTYSYYPPPEVSLGGSSFRHTSTPAELYSFLSLTAFPYGFFSLYPTPPPYSYSTLNT